MTEVKLVKFIFKSGKKQVWLDWCEELKRRKDEVVETLKNEGVISESCFISEDEQTIYYFMEAEDFKKAKKAVNKSTFQIDTEHKIARETSIEFVEKLTPLFHFVRKQKSKKPLDRNQYFQKVGTSLEEAKFFDKLYWNFNNDVLKPHQEHGPINRENPFYDLLEWGWIYKVIMTIRKSVDPDDDSFSLTQLLEDFKITATPEESVLIQQDLDQIRSNVVKCREYANKVLAHNSKKLPKAETVRKEVREVLNLLWDIFQKYARTHHQSEITERELPGDWKSIFYQSWIGK